MPIIIDLKISSVTKNTAGGFDIIGHIPNWPNPAGPALTTYEATMFLPTELPTPQHRHMSAEPAHFGVGQPSPAPTAKPVEPSPDGHGPKVA